ncbi:WXG100 family type VII secretion target [Kitasatospora sp. NPDC101801]|uniref:WXG100 family type VII secretion target n=1 Tax=Kitasatospora sp. NPDC101801 TaxID=3364103 RepID=UPI00381CD4AB
MIAGTDVSFGDLGAGFKWTRDFVSEPLLPLPSFSNPVADGLDAGLDDAVRGALEFTGLMGMLEEVTGELETLTRAADEWQAQALAMQQVAAELRAGGATLAGQWEGEAATAFGNHMGKVVEAIDATAADMNQVAQIISQAAAACQLAENLVIELIREAIEVLIATLAAMILVDIVTLGLAAVTNALVVEAEVTIFIARVARVSQKLADTLTELMKAVRTIQSAGKSFRTIKEGLNAAKAVRKVGSLGERLATGRNLLAAPSAVTAGEFAAAQGTKMVFGAVKGGIATGVGTVIGAGDYGGSLLDAAKDDATVDAVTGELDGGPKGAPYRVDRARLEEAFG